MSRFCDFFLFWTNKNIFYSVKQLFIPLIKLFIFALYYWNIYLMFSFNFYIFVTILESEAAAMPYIQLIPQYKFP